MTQSRVPLRRLLADIEGDGLDTLASCVRLLVDHRAFQARVVDSSSHVGKRSNLPGHILRDLCKRGVAIKISPPASKAQVVVSRMRLVLKSDGLSLRPVHAAIPSNKRMLPPPPTPLPATQAVIFTILSWDVFLRRTTGLGSFNSHGVTKRVACSSRSVVDVICSSHWS